MIVACVRSVENSRGFRDCRKSLPERRKTTNAGSSHSRRRALTQLSAEIPQIEKAPRAQPSSNKLARDPMTETLEAARLGELALLSVPLKRKQPSKKPALVRLTRMRA